MPFVTPAMQAVLDGKDYTPPAREGEPAPPADPALARYYRVEAAWAKAHDLAADAFNGDPTQFFGPHGDGLMKALQAAPPGLAAGELVALARKAIDAVKPPAPAPAPAPPPAPAPAPAPEPEHP